MWNVAKAARQIRGTLEWRRENKPHLTPCVDCQTNPEGHDMVNFIVSIIKKKI